LNWVERLREEEGNEYLVRVPFETRLDDFFSSLA